MTTNTVTESATEALSDEDYAISERVLDELSDRCCRDFSPSEIARFAKATTDEVRRVLPALVADGNVAAHGNGAWTRYRFVWG